MTAAYLDNNATTRPCDEATHAMARANAELWHNPSSVHRAGQRVRAEVELAREQIAKLIGAKPREIVFTGSGTEAIDLAIRGVIGAGLKKVLLTDAAEHAAVRSLSQELAFMGVCEVRPIPIVPLTETGGGAVDADALPGLLATGDVGLVSVQWANNETGIINPIEAIGCACREAGVPFHTDATQWVGKMPTDLSGQAAGGHDGFIDLLTCAPHKFHGPKGVGVLWARRGIRYRPQIQGSQELGRRGGTENVPGILAAGAAAEAAAAWLDDPAGRERVAALRNRLESGVLERVSGAAIHGLASDRLWNTTSLGFPGLEAEAILMLLSEVGIAASAGAACSSGSLDPSPVLLALGMEPRVAHGTIRLSLSRETTETEVEHTLTVIPGVIERLGGCR